MKSDKSRDTFHPEKHYSSVRLQQGRVLTDADWNEETDIERHRDVSLVRDMVGPTGVPEESDGFRVMPILPVTGGVADVELKRGRMYVDGILVEQDIPGVTYRTQPDLPLQGLPPITITAGTFAAYLDVWDRHIGWLEDSAIREVALGGPDTATRAKTVWQLKFLTLANAAGSPPSPIEDVEATAQWQLLIQTNTSTGTMRARARQESAQQDPCIIPEAAGFRRLENQLYRVEIHRVGTLAGGTSTGAPPTFVWSRDNGSVVAQWLDVPETEDQLRVSQPTRDEALGFAQGQWIELTDDTRELRGEAGLLVQILRVDGDLITYDPGGQTIIFTEFPKNPKVRRWDSAGAINVARDAGTNEGYIALEGGVEVRFEDGTYRVGDYWMIPARTISGSIEWPADPADPTQPQALLAAGIKHHFTPLLSFTMPNFALQVDLRKLFPTLTQLPTKGTEADQPPRSGQFRYYLIDGNLGSDMTGRVGIDFDPAIAFAEAVPFPFKSYTRVAQILPRDGHDSIAVILIKPLPGGARYEGEFAITGLHGYRRVYIRGSNLANDDADRVQCAAVPIDEFPTGISLTGSRTRAFDDPHYGNETELLSAVPLPTDREILNGCRTRLISANPFIGTERRSMILRNEQVADDGQANVIRLVDGVSGIVPNDTLLVERPGTLIGEVILNDIFSPLDLIGLDCAAVRAQRVFIPAKESAPLSSLSFSFCRVQIMTISNFHSVITAINPAREDGVPDFNHSLGACLRFSGGNAAFQHGELVALNAFSSTGSASFTDVKRVTIVETVTDNSPAFEDCPSARVGSTNVLGGALPRTVDIGRGGGAVNVNRSSVVLDHVFIAHTDLNFASIFVQGARPTLDILENTVRANFLGITVSLLSSTEANVFVANPETAFKLSGESFRLATDVDFVGSQLRSTNTIDFAGNRIRGPFGNLITDGWGSAIQGNVTNFEVVRLPTYDNGTDPPTNLIRAERNGAETDAALRASIVGVVQQSALASNTAARVIVVSSGYTLVSVATDSRTTPAGFLFPAPIFLHPSEAGAITFEPNAIPLGVAFRFFSNIFPNTQVVARLQLPVL